MAAEQLQIDDAAERREKRSSLDVPVEEGTILVGMGMTRAGRR